MAFKPKRKSPRGFRFRRAKEEACGFFENHSSKPEEDQIKKEIERIVNKWNLADESGIEEWFRLFMLLESDKLWPTSPEMPETLWDKISPRIPEFIPWQQ